jgi:uncharacterized RDD family membrane protein YckC
MRAKTLILYDATQADRMKQLSGVRLATFSSRAAALLIDFMLASLLFLTVMAALILTAKYIPAVRDWDASHDVHIELNFLITGIALHTWRCSLASRSTGAMAGLSASG